MQTCTVQGNGCTAWGAAANCSGTDTCQGSACTCNNICTLNDTRCSGTQIQTCVKQPSGCTDWSAATDCSGTDTCQGKNCKCNDQCKVGDTQCSGANVQTCATQASGCTGWGAATACASPLSCIGNACACPGGPGACCGGTGQPCCAGSACNAALGCGSTQVCGDPCDPSFRLLTAADGLVDGSRIPSQYANPAKKYIWGRSTSNLTSVGVATAVTDLAKRVDGVGPFDVDGNYDLDELLAMSCPAYFATLFPAEQALIPTLWSLLEFDDLPLTPVSPQTTYDVTITDISTPPGGLTFAPSEPISSLPTSPTNLQDAANRLELVFNDDATTTTVSMADCTAGMNDSLQRFSASDVSAFDQIWVLLHSHGVSSADARVRVPTPFDQIDALGSLGGVQIRALSSVAYGESRNYDPTAYSGTWTILLNMKHSVQPQVLVPASEDSIFLRTDSRAEQYFGAGATSLTSLTTPAAGGYIIEEWKAGTRLGAYRVALPKYMVVSVTTDMGTYVDYYLQTPTGTVLSKNQKTGTLSSGVGYSTYGATYSYDVGVIPPTGIQSASADAQCSTPPFVMPPGRYEFTTATWGKVDVDVYKQGVVFATIVSTGNKRRMPHTQTNYRKDFYAVTGSPTVLLEPTYQTGRTITMSSPVFTIDLTEKMRIQ